MQIKFLKAKNGQDSCSCNSVLLHSGYNPDREAEKFVNRLTVNFNPSFIVITEPALSYCVLYLRKRFPTAKLVAVRYTAFFKEYDDLWDYVFYDFNNPALLTQHLCSFLTEEKILSTFFIAWEPSSCFTEIDKTVWTAIKKAVDRAQKVILTRQFFSEKWIKNICKFCINLSQYYSLSKGHSPIVVASSGPSLDYAINFIKSYRNSFFLIAVSSAILPLIHKNIVPDLCISTDGGNWAKKHLDILQSAEKSIPVAASAESSLNTFFFSNGNPIIPLTYHDTIEERCLSACSITAFPAVRNGTVSGTAVDLALSLTDGPVFCCGLDLCSSKGFQHTQPNALELYESKEDFRLHTKEDRTSRQGMNSYSLNIYRNWFSSQDFNGRVFRLADDYSFFHSIESIKDVNSSFYESQKRSAELPKILYTESTSSPEEKSQILLYIVKELSQTEDWLENVFPADFILYRRCIDKAEKKRIYNILSKKNSKLVEKLIELI